MGFQQGLSGLNAASKSLEVTGNNVANSSTVGFKSAQAQFADVYASSLTGGGASQVGIGTSVATVAQQFTQGNVTASNNPLDLAINGGGFFRLSSGGAITYSRNGQFQLDKNGGIVNSKGAHLSGFAVTSTGTLATGTPTDLVINTADLAPNKTKDVKLLVNLDSREVTPSKTPFDQNDPLTYNRSTSVSIFDSLGNSHVLQSYFVKAAPPVASTWDVYGTVDGNPLTSPLIGTLSFNTDGGLTALPVQPFVSTVTAATTPGASLLTFNFDFTGTTQFGSTFGLNTQSQDGYTSGKLSGFSTGADGIISGRYTNGKSATLGQVVLSNFTNPNGLQNLGNNVWTETAASGGPLVGTPSSGNLGVLQSSAVEDSNVDLTAELVNMITAQRFYQANAQTIKTQDQVLQTLVNLR
ncbi:flagellar hook protein FlgE [Actimicrobium sp. CCI2.3]|uniref:flagellar hook protein FlgE n=1 Tax=Actimicrobium sp. CCI2.3 TaxID=3048616 RepID=UPI002AB3BC34|nr:flagellar hook protein FlgE [Actimicrobium sp. CCI2.3]MDY7575021.1 flagellar hook protein FlgE [Actimicrobium sp. CCI2.3]MEB0021408.1 flagellar hook protein FlgE [Actimicrobium sp. CCI2.3]